MTKQSVFLLLISLILAHTSQATESSLEKYRGQNRPLLVFAPDEQHPAYQQTLEAVNDNRSGFIDRDMILISVFADAGMADDKPLSGSAAQSLYQRHEIEPGEFRILLIGKDGGVKLRSAETADMDEIFRLIDGMPMRQREMHNR